VLENITSGANVIGRNSIGGLVGYGNFDGARIANCTFTGTVRNHDNMSANEVGGIIGRATLLNSSASPSLITNCRVVVNPNGRIDAPSEYDGVARIRGNAEVGGIVGDGAALTIRQSYTTVFIQGTQRVGGIAGHLQAASGYMTTIQDSFSTGNIVATNNGSAGGIVGNTTGNTSTRGHLINRCYSRAAVTSAGTRTGGIIGDDGTSSAAATVVHNSFAINREVVQAGTNTSSTGRISGTNNNYKWNNHARQNLQANPNIVFPMFYGNAWRIVIGRDDKNGWDISDALLIIQSTYVNLTSWDFNATNGIWIMNHNLSPYPILRRVTGISSIILNSNFVLDTAQDMFVSDIAFIEESVYEEPGYEKSIYEEFAFDEYTLDEYTVEESDYEGRTYEGLTYEEIKQILSQRIYLD
jgi:hypothetical protein